MQLGIRHENAMTLELNEPEWYDEPGAARARYNKCREQVRSCELVRRPKEGK